jgi:hypothetical protein
LKWRPAEWCTESNVTTYPREIWRQIWSSNPQERVNKEIRRRTDIVGIFPDRDANIRLVSAVLAEQHDEWIETHRYFGLEILAKVDAGNTPPDTPEISVTPEAPPNNLNPDHAESLSVHHPPGRDLCTAIDGRYCGTPQAAPCRPHSP